MYEYLAEQAEMKRQAPAGDLLSYLVHAEDDGDRLSHDELMSQLITLYMAGHEPTAGLVGNGILALLRQPDQLARLRAEPDLIRNAVSELLRFDGPNQFVRRITHPADRGRRRRGAGRRGALSPAWPRPTATRAGGARRPTQVVVDRADADQHLQFGGGVHACLGSHLARLQAELFARRDPAHGSTASSSPASRCGAPACSSAGSARSRCAARSAPDRLVPSDARCQEGLDTLGIPLDRPFGERPTRRCRLVPMATPLRLWCRGRGARGCRVRSGMTR